VPQVLPYFLSGNVSTTFAQSVLSSYYTSVNRLTLNQLTTDTVNEFVFGLRQANINNIIYQYYVGMSLNLTSNASLAATLYYSNLAYHSPANILNDLDSILLMVATGDTTRSISTTNIPLSSNDTLSAQASYLDVLACIDILPLSLLNFLNSIIVAFLISFMVRVNVLFK
jgi:hypothetical protein